MHKSKKPVRRQAFSLPNFLFLESADGPNNQGDYDNDEENAHAHTGFKNPFNEVTARKQNHYQE